MSKVESWIANIKHWYTPAGDHDITLLCQLIVKVPEDIFNAPSHQLKNEAIAYFTDACFKIQKYYQNQNDVENTLNYMHFCYAKLQSLASSSNIDISMKRWSLKKLDQLMSMMIYFCQQQSDPRWQLESKKWIDLHVIFMQCQQNLSPSPSKKSP